MKRCSAASRQPGALDIILSLPIWSDVIIRRRAPLGNRQELDDRSRVVDVMRHLREVKYK